MRGISQNRFEQTPQSPARQSRAGRAARAGFIGLGAAIGPVGLALGAAFRRASCSAEVARAEYQLADALARQARLDGVDTANGEWRDYRDRCLDHLRQSALALAQTPAPDHRDIEIKRRRIGRIWLTAEGAFYDALRAGVAADEARLARDRKYQTRHRVVT